MNGRLTLHLSEYIIWRASRHLPADIAVERYREWIAELPHIVGDKDVRPQLLRVAMALAFAVDQHRTVHRHPEATHYSWSDAADGLVLALQLIFYTVKVVIGVIIYSPLGFVPGALLGGVICVVGVFTGHLSGAGPSVVLLWSAGAGGLVAGLVKGRRFLQGALDDISDLWDLRRGRARRARKVRESTKWLPPQA
jgi:hypothetical protein